MGVGNEDMGCMVDDGVTQGAATKVVALPRTNLGEPMDLACADHVEPRIRRLGAPGEMLDNVGPNRPQTLVRQAVAIQRRQSCKFSIVDQVNHPGAPIAATSTSSGLNSVKSSLARSLECEPPSDLSQVVPAEVDE